MINLALSDGAGHGNLVAGTMLEQFVLLIHLLRYHYGASNSETSKLAICNAMTIGIISAEFTRLIMLLELMLKFSEMTMTWDQSNK